MVNNSSFENGNPTNINNSMCQYQSIAGFDNEINNFTHIIIQNQNRTKVMALSGFISGKYENGNHLRVHLRQNGGANNWDNQNNNQKLNNERNFF